MKKYILGALSIALTAVVFAFAIPNKPKEEAKVQDFYYKFIGTHGQENDMSKWVQLTDLDEYEDVNCPQGNAVACRIINTTNSAGHPTSVPLTSGGLPDPGASVNKEVINRLQ